ncbi:Uncharacterised protein [uncultured archaeon]|nr:Uncharacterised protein [uncultured archaeon]
MIDENAQLYTLEGLGAATILMMVIVYAIDATSMTPLTSSTSNAHGENELAALGQDILNTLDYAEPGYRSNLQNDIIKWDGEMYVWSGTNYIADGNLSNNLTNNLTIILNATLVKQGIAHNVEVTFLTSNGTTYSRQKMIYNGDPSDNAVIVSRKIVLQDNDGNFAGSPIADIDRSTNLHNIVDIKLILWST